MSLVRALRPFLLLPLLLTACGGGGGGGSEPITLYVRAAGNDGNTGESPDQALASPRTALIRARAGDTILVGPGSYFPPDETPGVVLEITAFTATNSRPLVIRADPTGTSTGDAPGAVILDADDKDRRSGV